LTGAPDRLTDAGPAFGRARSGMLPGWGVSVSPAAGGRVLLNQCPGTGQTELLDPHGNRRRISCPELQETILPFLDD